MQNRLGADGLRVREGRSGAHADDDRRTRSCRSRSSSIRAIACTCATSPSTARPRSTTKCCAARCASSKAAGSRTSRSSARSSASSACRTSRRWSPRPSRSPAPPDLVDVELRDGGGPVRAARRRHRLLRVAELHPERQLRRRELHGHRPSASRRSQLRPLQQGVQLFASPSPYPRRQRRPHRQRSRIATSDPVRLGVVGLLVGNHRRRASTIGYPISRVPGLRFGVSLPERRACSRAAAAARTRRVDWVRRTAIPVAASIDDHGSGTRTRPQFYGTKFNTAELTHRLELRHPQPRAVRGPRHAPLASVCPTRCPG